MLHVNDDTNDELFRKAAEDYFLGADKPDWDTLLHKMNTGDSFVPEMLTQKKKKQYRFLSSFSSTHSIFRLFRLRTWLEKNKKKIKAAVWRRLPGRPQEKYYCYETGCQYTVQTALQ